MDEKPKKTLVNIIDDSEAIAHALNILSVHSREYSTGGLFRDQSGFWEVIEPLIEAYRSYNHEAIIYATSQGFPINSKKTRLKELIIKIIRNPEVFGLKEIKKGHVEYILLELYPDELDVFPTSKGQKNTWWEEIGLPIRQYRGRENPAFLKRVAEIKANNKGGTPDFEANRGIKWREMVEKVRVLLGTKIDPVEFEKIWDEGEDVKYPSIKLKPEDRNDLNYRPFLTSSTEDEDPFR
jgi:hypothetical protein